MPEILGSVRHLTFDADGCRLVQKALEKADQHDAASICAELHGCVRRALTSPYGNYVVQKIVEVMPAPLSSFISKEIVGFGVEVARHRFGCRILCRLLEHSSQDSQTIELFDEILLEVATLSRHNFGHHVIESILEHGLDEQKHQIAIALWSQVFVFATDSYATYVIESALRNCCMADCRLIVDALVVDRESFLQLAQHDSGFHVVIALLKYSEQRSALSAVLIEERFRLQGNYYGSRVLQELR